MSTAVGIESIRPSMAFKSDLMLDKNFILLPADAPVTQELIDLLKTWEFSELQCEQGISASAAKKEPAPAEEPPKPKKKLVRRRRAKLPSAAGEKDRIATVKDAYGEMVEFTTALYRRYATQKQIDKEALEEQMRGFCDFIRVNKRYVLRIFSSAEMRSRNYLVTHLVRTTVLAVTIGIEMQVEPERLVELGTAAVLHELGMLRIPPQLYINDRPLPNSARAQISLHPILGYNAVKELDFPLAIQLGVLDHHETENGTGYPRHLEGAKISIYAKIIAVACAFEAITAPRGYRPERELHSAMTEILRNSDGRYDKKIIKALMQSLSIYPIGSCVALNSGMFALVIDVLPDAPANPIVRILDGDGASLKTVRTDDGENKIMRALTKGEAEEFQRRIHEAEAGASAEGNANAADDEYEEYYEEVDAPQDGGASEQLALAERQKKIDAQFSAVDLSDFF